MRVLYLVIFFAVVTVCSRRNKRENLLLTPEEILAAIPPNWLPPLPPFMEDASEESKHVRLHIPCKH